MQNKDRTILVKAGVGGQSPNSSSPSLALATQGLLKGSHSPPQPQIQRPLIEIFSESLPQSLSMILSLRYHVNLPDLEPSKVKLCLLQFFS